MLFSQFWSDLCDFIGCLFFSFVGFSLYSTCVCQGNEERLCQGHLWSQNSDHPIPDSVSGYFVYSSVFTYRYIIIT